MDFSYQKMSYQSFMTMMMKWLFIGLGITALTSFVLSATGIIYALYRFYFPLTLVLCIVEIALVYRLSKKVRELSIDEAKRYFYIYSIVNGVTMSFILNMYAPGAVVLAFALTCAFFGLLYAVAKNTTYSFARAGHICLMALPILIIGYVILFFIHAPAVYYAIVTIDLVLFTFITLYDMKKVRYAYDYSSDEYLEGASLICALQLYMDFVNIFIDILILINDNR